MADATALAEQIKEASQAAIAAARSNDLLTDSQPAGSQQDKGTPERPVYLSTISQEKWASLPEDARQALSEHGKQLYGDYQRKSEELAGVRRLKEYFEADGGRLDAAKSAIDVYERKKLGLEPESEQSAKATQSEQDLIDELKANPDPEIRKQAARLDESISRRTKGMDTVLKTLNELKATVNGLQSQQSNTRQSEVREQLAKLPPAYTPLLEKYRDDLLTKSAQYPNLDLERLIQITASPDEYKEAIRAEALADNRRQVDKAKESGNTNRPAGTTSTVPSGLQESDYRVRKLGPITRKELDTRSLIGRVFGEIRSKIPGR